MALETADFINQLVTTNPTGGDPKGQGDDHLRLLKRVLKTQFPNLDSAVTVTPAQINQLTRPDALVPVGLISMWSGNLSFLPSGWKLCNGVGTLSNGAPVPDMRDRFPVGAGLTYPVFSTGGAANHSHTMSVLINGTALTAAQLPPHSHTYAIGLNDTVGTGWTQASPGNSNGVNSPAYTLDTSAVGSGATHTHTATYSMGTASSLPPYFAVGFIIKD